MRLLVSAPLFLVWCSMVSAACDLSANSLCLRCDTYGNPNNCDKCKGGSGLKSVDVYTISCVECDNGGLTATDNKTCTLDCNPYEYKDFEVRQCKKCFLEGCKWCTSATVCFSCNETTVMAKDNTTCLDSCPEGQSPNFYNRCFTCATANCAKCTYQDSCTKCISGKFLHESKCIESCPEGYYPDANSSCQSCIHLYGMCATCPSSGVCTKCSGDSFLTTKAECREACPEGEEIDASVKEYKKCKIAGTPDSNITNETNNTDSAGGNNTTNGNNTNNTNNSGVNTTNGTGIKYGSFSSLKLIVGVTMTLFITLY